MERLGLQWRMFRPELVALFVMIFAPAALGQLSANPTNINFGNVPLGTTAAQSAVMSNTGGSTLIVSQVTATGRGFTWSGVSLPIVLTPGKNVTLGISFTPTVTGSTVGTIVMVTTSSNHRNWKRTITATISLSGTAVTSSQLSTNPGSLSFGTVAVGSTQTGWETLTNSGNFTVTISRVTTTGPGFTTPSLTLPLTLAAGQSLSLGVTFSPQSSGTATGSIAILSNAANSSLSIPLAGTGYVPGTMAISPSALNFGSVVVGTSQSQTGTVTASGSAVTVTSATSNSSEFVLSGLAVPVTIGVGQSATFTVTFLPQTSGSASGSISFLSNASNPSGSESLTGTGAAPAQHNVGLTWTENSSQVAGYNVYRGTKSGGPYSKINSALDPSTSYTDTATQAGSTYYYVTTAVDSTGSESAYSNEASAVIPSN